jgi:hypothetical protein
MDARDRACGSIARCTASGTRDSKKRPWWRLRPQPTALRQPTPQRRPTPLGQPIEMALLEDMPVEPTVALLVRPTAMPLALPLRSIPVIRPSPLALVGRPMPLLLDHMPQTLPSRMNGTPLPARTDAATCASRTPTPCAVMVSIRNERRSPLILSPAPSGAFFLCRPLGTPPCGAPNPGVAVLTLYAVSAGLARRRQVPGPASPITRSGVRIGCAETVDARHRREALLLRGVAAVDRPV